MTKNGVLRQIAELERVPFSDLKTRWTELYGDVPRPHHRSLVVKRLAYRIQELAFGGLSDAARKELQDLAAASGLDGEAGAQRLPRRKKLNGLPVAGTLLVREWQGKRYEVTVERGGFEFQGRKYRSLSAISKVITGAHWNGPAFFGLRKKA